jgi:hypothetical protein
MLAVTIKFNNGKQMDGLLWTWRPERDLVEVMSEKDGKVRKINLDNVLEGVIYSSRVRQDDDPGAVDLLQKARDEGWSKQ